MLKLFLFSVSVLYAQDASTQCSSTAAAQTRALPGPAGVSAVLKVSIADDSSKETHDCMAEYQLLFRGANASSPEIVNLLSSDADWERRLSLHLDGFSNDGTRVFGILSEDGRYGFTNLFEYSVRTGQVRLIDLRKGLTALAAAKCGTTLAVAGTTKTHAIVLKPETSDPCGLQYRWQLNAATGDLHRLGDRALIVDLYE